MPLRPTGWRWGVPAPLSRLVVANCTLNPNKNPERLQGPLMLEMGVLPDVAAATSATMILFTSAAAAAVFLSFGGVPPAYAALAFTIGLLSTAAGQVWG